MHELEFKLVAFVASHSIVIVKRFIICSIIHKRKLNND